ncbi:hypothetical protein TTHERM_00492800 (macronuclear) [Tetrahymena thermophila SB210]|uniref:VHS domain-containing protein n=1 Tax=Tetrahymena thermophila (strain SB210) TaxID=312017 RepID=I7M3D2_TETTS|nr:hypothetical protein TTHERM_00492800 [Tetrahymena thermophila SB210]EAS02927.1 hypothetical protein TTHERM_00492800 [Tetrahymena thermophila SB210]|eukprot:XP_001023172.1 hypothetical protein TTHERM_00492800 [Tetrahymena thermophila SB210]
MSLRELDNLRVYLISKDQYKKTGRYKENIKQGNSEIIPVVLETIESIITNKKEEPMTRLNALRLLKECVDLDNELFNHNVENGVLNTIYQFAIQLDRKTLLKANPTVHEEKISMSFYILCLECIKMWAHWYPEHKGASSQFKKLYISLKDNGFKFPANFNFFKDADLYKFNPQRKAEYLLTNTLKQVEFLKNIQDNESYDQIILTLRDFDYFLRHSNEIIHNQHQDIPQNTQRDLHMVQPLVASLHPILNEFKIGNITFIQLRKQIQNVINNYETSTHQRSSEPFISHKHISPNSSEDFDLKCENIMLSSINNMQMSQSLLDDKQIHSILRQNQNNNNNINYAGSQMQNTNSVVSFDTNDIDFNKNTSILDQKSSFAQKSSQQQLFQRVAANPSKQIAQNKDFNFTEQGQIESLEERVAQLEKSKEILEQKQIQQISAIEALITENKKLQTLVDQKQDEIDLLESKKTYFSYSTDYQNLLCTHQKLEQDYNELLHKSKNFESEKDLIVQENEHLKQQQVSLKEMVENQKETIKQLQIRVNDLQNNINVLENERESFKKDLDRKYQINQLINIQQKNDYQVSQNLDISNNYASLPAPNTLHKFNQKDFMRGISVPKNLNLFSFLNDDCEINSYTFKLGCLHSSVNIYENDLIKVLVCKIDQQELNQNIIQNPNGAPVTAHMGLNISILNKSNINLKHFEISYRSNNSLKITSDTANSSQAAYVLNSQNIFQQKIYIEVNTIPFQVPNMIIKLQSNYISQNLTIPLPITINSMVQSQAISQNSLNDTIGNWNSSPNDSIYKSVVFTVSKQLVDKKYSLHQFFPTFTHVQSASINFYELIGIVKIPLVNNIKAALKVTLVNDRFICFQIKPLTQEMRSLSGSENQAYPMLKNIQSNTLQFIIQTYQELFSD